MVIGIQSLEGSMLVNELMTPGPQACAPDTNLCEAVRMMWDGDFGVLPVVDDEGHLLGIVTDRDVSMAVGTRNVAPSQLRVEDVMTKDVQTCHAVQGVKSALEVMAEHRVRRLPVVDADGRLCGMFSLNDAVLAGDKSVRAVDLIQTLRSVSTHRQPSKGALVSAA
jgi:CBS domain-containing protein